MKTFTRLLVLLLVMTLVVIPTQVACATTATTTEMTTASTAEVKTKGPLAVNAKQLRSKTAKAPVLTKKQLQTRIAYSREILFYRQDNGWLYIFYNPGLVSVARVKEQHIDVVLGTMARKVTKLKRVLMFWSRDPDKKIGGCEYLKNLKYSQSLGPVAEFLGFEVLHGTREVWFSNTVFTLVL